MPTNWELIINKKKIEHLTTKFDSEEKCEVRNGEIVFEDNFFAQIGKVIFKWEKMSEVKLYYIMQSRNNVNKQGIDLGIINASILFHGAESWKLDTTNRLLTKLWIFLKGNKRIKVRHSMDDGHKTNYNLRTAWRKKIKKFRILEDDEKDQNSGNDVGI